MLTSIHPLGERARNMSFGVTAAALALGAIAGGALTGAALGAIGSLFLDGDDLPGWSLAALAVAGLVAAAAEWADRRVPGVRRQVNEDWLVTYRGWVYGVGYGFQLGLGWATIITSAAVPMAGALAFASAEPVAGALIGAVFGMARAAPLVLGRTVRTPAALHELHARLTAARAPARRWSAGVLLGVAVALVLAGAGGT